MNEELLSLIDKNDTTFILGVAGAGKTTTLQKLKVRFENERKKVLLTSNINSAIRVFTVRENIPKSLKNTTVYGLSVRAFVKY